MKLHIIQPTHYRSPANRSLHHTKKRSVVNLTLPYLAALTPREWDVTLIDEQLSYLDFNAPVDLVAITAWTMNSIRAYEIADKFRERGVTVIMGGPHTFFHEEEAAEHCDAVGVGEGEGIWSLMLEDAAAGRLKKFYRADRLHALEQLPLPRYDLIDLRRGTRQPMLAIILGGWSIMTSARQKQRIDHMNTLVAMVSFGVGADRL